MQSLYDFTCKCGYKEEYLVDYEERDTIELECPVCGKTLKREMPAPSYHGEVFQTKAVLPSGEEVPGHFGKEAPRKRKK